MHAAIGGRAAGAQRILGLTACPAGEINYYLLRSLGLNGGNDVHHAQREHRELDARGSPWYVATDFRRLIENEGATFAGPDSLLWPCSRSLAGPFLMATGSHYAACVLSLKILRINKKEIHRIHPKRVREGVDGRGWAVERGIYRKFRGHYYLAGRVKNIYALPNCCPRPS